MGQYSVHLVGESNYQRAIGDLRPGVPVTLVHEPDNRHDERAISARVQIKGRLETIGYLERGSWVARVLLDDATPVHARVERIIGGEPGKPSLGVVLEVRTAREASEVIPTAELMLIEQRVGNLKKSVGAAYLLWFFLWWASAHRFYLGRPGTAVLQILSYFVLIGFVWVIIDAVLIPGMVDAHAERERARMMTARRQQLGG